jgi:hypothetical protein
VALVRGRTLVPVRAFLKESFGARGWARVLAELPPPDRAVLDGLIVPDAWYERRLHSALLEQAFRFWHKEMPDLGRNLGARVAAHHDRFYLRPLIRLGGPMIVVKRAAALYREYFQGGDLSVIERRENGARLRLDDPHALRWFCGETLPGFARGIASLAGRRVVRAEQVVCRFDGADHCELELEWE